MAKSYITYTLGGSRGIFPLESIVEIYRVVGFQRLAGVPERVIGYCAFRGAILFGVDIQDVFDISDHVYNSDANLIISMYQNYRFGILVDTIGAIIRLDDSQEVAREHYPSSMKDRYIKRAYTIDNVVHFEVDLLNLFSEDEKARILDRSSKIEATLSGQLS